MEFGYVVAFVACLLGAGGMYVALEFNLHGERQDALAKLLKAQTDTAAARKEVQGYAKFMDYLAAGKAEMSDKLKLHLLKISREHHHSEMISKEQFKTKMPILIAVYYSVEYSFNMDLNVDRMEVKGSPDGIEIVMAKPMLLGFPSIKIQSHELGIDEPMVDQKSVVNEVQVKLPAIVRKYGVAIASEEATLAICEKKLVAFLRDYLSAQSGVKQLPGIKVTFK